MNTKNNYWLYGILFLSGIAGLGYEIVWMKMLSYGLGHEGPAMLATTAAFFIGLALGSWVLDKPIRHSSNPQRIYAALEFIVGLWSLVLIFLIPKVNNWSGYLISIDVTPLRHWIVAFVIPGLFLLPATFSMGGTLPAMERFITARRCGGRHLAGIYAANTFGAMTGTIVVTFIVAPVLGYTYTLSLLAIINFFCAGIISLYKCEIQNHNSESVAYKSNHDIKLYSALFTTGLLGIGYEVLIVRVLSQILENTVYSFATLLAVYLMGSAIGATLYQKRWCHLDTIKLTSRLLIGLSIVCLTGVPLLLHPNPQRALFLGIGTGGTLAAAADYPDLETDAVELVPEVIDVMDMFRESTGDLIHNPKIHIHAADARRFVKQSKEHYDVIIADLFHPARDGAGSLYTREHFDSVRKCLNPDGIFCQWLPLYQMDIETIRTIIRTFLSSFPEVRAFITHYNIETPIVGLVGYNRMMRYDQTWFEKRVRYNSLSEALKKLRLTDNYTLFGRFIAGREDLYNFAGMGAINTDDKPVVTYSTPSFVYNRQEPPFERLLTLLNVFLPKPEQVIESNDPEISRRLAAYWHARDEFIKLGASADQSQSGSEMIKNLVDPLLAIVQESPDFSAAYNPLLGMALNLSSSDKKGALILLQKLQQANPGRTEPGELIRYISSLK